jgi:hypothetical protein
MLCIPFIGVCANLEVEITGMRNTKGQIKVGVYKDKETFPKTGSELKGINVLPAQKLADGPTFRAESNHFWSEKLKNSEIDY